MRVILICSLAATLAGCSCLAPQQAIMGACADPERYNCFDNRAAATRIQAKSTTTKISSVARTKAVPAAQAAAPHLSQKASVKTAAAKNSKPKLASKATSSHVESKAPASKAGTGHDKAKPKLASKSGPVHKKAPTELAAKAVGPRAEPNGNVSILAPVHEKAKVTQVAKAVGPRAEPNGNVSILAPVHEKAKVTHAVEIPRQPIAVKSAAAQPVAPGPAPAPNQATAALAAKVQAPPLSAQAGEIFDPIVGRARSLVAARTADPASVEFVQMKRAIRKNDLGQPIDTICGRVKGKTTKSADRTEMPFLYIVRDDDAFIVDGSNLDAAAAYSSICK
jgi:hypothetical protein